MQSQQQKWSDEWYFKKDLKTVLSKYKRWVAERKDEMTALVDTKKVEEKKKMLDESDKIERE